MTEGCVAQHHRLFPKGSRWKSACGHGTSVEEREVRLQREDVFSDVVCATRLVTCYRDWDDFTLVRKASAVALL